MEDSRPLSPSDTQNLDMGRQSTCVMPTLTDTLWCVVLLSSLLPLPWFPGSPHPHWTSHICGQFHSWAMANQCVCAPIPIFSRMRVFLCTFTTNLALFSPWTYSSSLPLSSHLGSSSIGYFVVYVLLWIGSNPIQDGYGEEICKTQQS